MSNDALGTDFECADDITADWRVATDPGVAFTHAMYRRLTNSRLFYSQENYGKAVEEYLADTDVTEAQMTQEITAELLKDERVRNVALTWINQRAEIVVIAHTGEEFSLTLDLNADTIAEALGLPDEPFTPPGVE